RIGWPLTTATVSSTSSARAGAASAAASATSGNHLPKLGIHDLHGETALQGLQVLIELLLLEDRADAALRVRERHRTLRLLLHDVVAELAADRAHELA